MTVKQRLGDIVKLTSGGTPSKKNVDYWGGDIPWISAKNMKDEFLSDSSIHITKEGLNHGSRLAPEGSLLLLVRGSGLFNDIPICYVERDVAFNQDVKCIESIEPEKLPNKYIFYWLKSQKYALSQSVGVTTIGAGKFDTDYILNMEIPIPSIEVIEKLVTFFDALTQKIRCNTKINDNLLQQISAIFRYWFTDNPEVDSMTQVPLADLCAVVTKGTTPTTLGKPFVSEGINFIKAESIQDNHSIDKNKFAYIDDETNSLLKRSIISAGDIVFTIAGSLGRFAIVDDSVLPANTNQAVAIIRADERKVTPEYLYSFFLGNWHNDYYTKRIQQAVQANLSLGTIKSLPIPVLSDQKMLEYLGLITPLIAMTKSNEQEITRLEQVRDTLLPRLMSGELDVSSLDI